MQVSAKVFWLFLMTLCLASCRYESRQIRHAIRRRADVLDQPNRMALWIDRQQVQRFAGYAIDVFILRNAAVMSYIQDVGFDFQLPILPAEVDYIELRWTSTEQFSYKFSDLKSLDPQVLYDPLISIPTVGTVPNKNTAFQLAIPCTRRTTGTATMYIVLQVTDASGKQIPGSPLKFHLRKRCVASDGRKICQQTCLSGGECNSQGQCVCKQGYFGNKCEHAGCSSPCLHGGKCILGQCSCLTGYYGDHCQHITGNCSIPCINGGKCNYDNVCSCPTGYVGQFCQKPICKRWCGVHGRCVGVNHCECHRGWRGKLCNKTVKHYYHAKEDFDQARRQRNKLRNNLRKVLVQKSRGAEVTNNHIVRRH